MADEPRRSGRATKGQHTKDKESADETSKQKGKGKKVAAKAEPEPEEEEEEEEDEIIRCICGQYEEEEDNPRSMICCDKCSAWQHNDCMGLPESYAPDQYFCEQCKPQDHEELVAAIARGEKAADVATRRREQVEAEKASKKKGKKGRKPTSRASEVHSTPTQEPEETPVSKKRKIEESPVPEIKPKRARASQAAEEPNGTRAPQVRKVSQAPVEKETKSEEPVGEPIAQDAKELSNSTRKNAATGLIRLFVDQTKDAVKSGTFVLASGTHAQGIGSHIGLHVEHAVYHTQSGGSGEPNDKYKEQLRSILHNVKKNPALAVRMMTKDLSANDLAAMDAREMASEEQKRKDAEMIKEMEKQHTIVEEEAPRIRRTHKGDEYIDESHQLAAESTTSNAPLKKAVTTSEADGEIKSPITVAAAAAAVAAPPGEPALRKPSAGGRGKPFGDPRRKSSSNFDIDKVWSGVQGSPDAENRRQSHGAYGASPPPIRTLTGNDPEIDNLLKDEDGDSEPYSPKEFQEEGIVWRGVVNGGNLGTFSTHARFAAGAQPDSDNLRLSWSEIIPSEIKIHGRIQPSKADDYLCGLEYSNTSELIIVSMAEPRVAHDVEEFNRFFQYLKSKDRYGVGMQHANLAIKDIYLLPMEKGQALPTVMKALEHKFSDPVDERLFLIPIVIKATELPHNVERMQRDGIPMSPSVGPPVAQTPITPFNEQPPVFPNPVPSKLPINGTSQPAGANSPAAVQHLPAHAHAQAQQTPVQTPIGTRSGPPSQTPQPQPSSNQQHAQHQRLSQTPQPHQPVPSQHPQRTQSVQARPSQSPAPGQSQNQQPPTHPAAAVNAWRILGPAWAMSQSVQQLIVQAPNAGENEFNVIKECIQENGEAAQDLGILTRMLQRKFTIQQNQKQAAAQAAAQAQAQAQAQGGQSPVGQQQQQQQQQNQQRKPKN